MSRSLAVALSALAATVYGQGVGTNTPETHPKLAHQQCKAGGACTTVDSSIVIDANWRWTHSKQGTTNCYTGNTWDTTQCPDNTACASACVLEGADYAKTYGITTASNALTLKFVTQSQEKNIGSRVYLMADDSKYQMFMLKNQEFTFDVDVSKLPCGLNGALYFSEMAADGGTSKYPSNTAGAKYGTGYCDAQCPHDVKFINGKVRRVQMLQPISHADTAYRPMSRAGRLQPTTQMPAPVAWVPAAPSSTSGKQTPNPPPSRLTPAPPLASSPA